VKTKTTLYLRGISTEVKNHFKAHCAKRGKTMTEKIEELMRDTIKKDSTLETR